MNPEIDVAVEAFVHALRLHSPKTMTTFRLFVNCEEHRVETTERTAADLKATGISMRNLRRQFIS